MIRITLIQAAVMIAMGCLYAEPGDDTVSPKFFDDGAFLKLQTDQARALQAKGRLVAGSDLIKQLARKSVSLELSKAVPAGAPLALADIYRKCSGSVFSIAEVQDCKGCGQVHVRSFGTGFAVTADGVLLTNRHIIEKLTSSSSRLVASTQDGTTYPVVEVLALARKMMPRQSGSMALALIRSRSARITTSAPTSP